VGKDFGFWHIIYKENLKMKKDLIATAKEKVIVRRRATEV